MALYDHIEREIVDELWEAKRSRIYDREVRDIWEAEIPARKMRQSQDSSLQVLYWSSRSLSKSRYLRHFSR